jgi:hypothetical protein
MGQNIVKRAKGTKVKINFQILHMTCVMFVLVYNFETFILGTPLTLHFRYKYILTKNWFYIMYIMHSCILSHKHEQLGCKWDNTSYTYLLFDYYCDYFLKIFLKHSWKSFRKNLWIFFLKIHIVLLRFMLEIWLKNVIFKKFEIHLQILLLLKCKCYSA